MFLYIVDKYSFSGLFRINVLHPYTRQCKHIYDSYTLNRTCILVVLKQCHYKRTMLDLTLNSLGSSLSIIATLTNMYLLTASMLLWLAC